MLQTLVCPGCRATLSVPAGAAGKAIRCPRCGRVQPIPDVVDAVPAGPPSDPELPPAEAGTDDPPARRPRREDDDDRPARRRHRDDEPRPRRRPARGRRGGPPAWVWLVVVAGVLVVLGGGVGLYFAFRGKPKDGVAADGWVKVTPEGTGLTFELPNRDEVQGIGDLGDRKQFGMSTYGCQVDRGGERPVVFLAVVNFHERHDQAMPDAALWRLAKQPGAVGSGDRWNKLVRRYQVQGRDALVFHQEFAEKVVLVVFEPGRTYLFEVRGPGVTPDDGQVKRFFDSVRFAK